MVFSWAALKLLLSPASILGGIKNTVFFVIEHWKEVTVACMLGLILHQNFMQFEMLKWAGIRTVPGVEQELSVKNEQLATCKENVATLKGEIKGLNTQVDKWADVSSQLQDQHNQLVAELADMREKSEKAVEDILNDPTPETCKDAIQYLKDAARERQK